MKEAHSSILVTGGAGYIGSHTVHWLQRQGASVVVLDNLVYGHRQAVPEGVPFYEGDIADGKLIAQIFRDHGVDSLIHFAAYAYVGESVTDPLKYYDNNVGRTAVLLRNAAQHGCKNVVFSSTCATYGVPDAIPITEKQAQHPINPYGRSKLMVEQMLEDCSQATGMGWVALRYFNAAGAQEDGLIGEDHNPETHLIPNVFRAIRGDLPALALFGDDYETPDGTCVRDYIHVVDLASAHELALRHLQNGRGSLACNVGTGRGISVKEIIAAVEEVSGRKVPVEIHPRRPGDPPSLVADASLARELLGWQPVYLDIRDTVRTAWNWFDGPRKGRFER